MIDVICPCGVTFQAKTRRAKYHSDACRKRGGRTGVATPIKPTEASSQPVPLLGGVERTTQVALKAADRLDTPLGQACIVLARRLDHSTFDTGSAVAAAAARFEALLASATKGNATSKPQVLRDELAERRAQHGA